MNRYGLAVIASALLLLAACGGRDTMASKSAAAYREAQAKGIPVEGGQEHGGHEGEGTADPSTMTAMDHSTMPGMDHSKMTAADHSNMAGMDHSTTTGMNHSKMGDMDHSKMTSMNHSKMTAADHSNMAGMDHSGAQPGSMAGMNHGAMPAMQHGGASAAVDVVTGAPRTNTEMQHIQPGATLAPDAFDTPAPSAVAEAQKASGGGHEGHGASKKEQ
jgi:uncharacterized protein involved in copper resistance